MKNWLIPKEPKLRNQLVEAKLNIARQKARENTNEDLAILMAMTLVKILEIKQESRRAFLLDLAEQCESFCHIHVQWEAFTVRPADIIIQKGTKGTYHSYLVDEVISDNEFICRFFTTRHPRECCPGGGAYKQIKPEQIQCVIKRTFEIDDLTFIFNFT